MTTITLPLKMCGALMRVVDSEKRALAFMKHELSLKPEDDFPDLIGISYPCHKDYNFMMGPAMWQDCSIEGEHGHLLLQCDDGTALLPHTIRCQADVEQVIADLVKAKTLGFGNEPQASALAFVLGNDPVTKKLPVGSEYPIEEHDLRQLGWWL